MAGMKRSFRTASSAIHGTGSRRPRARVSTRRSSPRTRSIERHFRFENRHGLAHDPHAVEFAGAEFELDVDAAGTMHVMALRAGESRGIARVRQQPLFG